MEHRPAVLGVLKQFLRELPDSLLPYAYHDVLMELAQEAKSICLQQVKAIIYALPLSHYATLRVIMLHLKKVSDHRRQAAEGKSRYKSVPDTVYLPSKEIEEMFAPLLIHPAKTTRWTGTNSASRIVIVDLILNECVEFLLDEEHGLNVPNDPQNATRLSLGFPKV
jgi:RhoGAP domain